MLRVSPSATLIQQQVMKTVAGLEGSELGLQVPDFVDQGLHGNISGQIIGIGGHGV